MKTFSYSRIGLLSVSAGIALLVSACNLSFGSKTIRAIGSTSMVFNSTPTCQLSGDQDSLNISWSPAHGANGTVTYGIYSDAGLTQLLTLTKNTNYTWDVTSVEADRFSVFITATDSQGTSNYISCYANPTGGKHEPSATLDGGATGASSGIWVSPAAQDKILVEWDATKVPSDVTVISVYLYDDAVYNDQHKNTTKRNPVCTTHWTQHYCLVNGLLPNLQYRFLVRGTNTSNFEDHNTDEGVYLDYHGSQVTGGTSTLDHEVANFSGILDLRKVGGVAGLSSLDIYVIPAQSGSLGAAVTGYIVSVSTTDDSVGPFTFTPQTESAWSTSSNFGVMYQPAYTGSPAVPVTKFRIDGLALGTKYCVNVRAFVDGVYTDSDHNSKDLNRITLCQSTNGLNAPSSFAGLKSLRPKAVTGSQTVDYFTGAWDAPSTDGVYSEFKVYWQPAPASEQANTTDANCYAQNWTGNSPSTTDSTTYPPVIVNESTFSGQMIGHGITQGVKYYAQVYTHYLYTGGGGQSVDVYSAPSNVMCVWTNPPLPSFQGLLSVRPAPDTGGNATGNTTLAWTFKSAADPNGSWTDYVFDVSTSPTLFSTDPTVIASRLAAGQTLFKNCRITDVNNTGNGVCPDNHMYINTLTQTTTSSTLSGLVPDTKYYLLAFARYYNSGDQVNGPFISSGPTAQASVIEVQTTPPKALGEAITNIFILDPNTVKITWQAPTSGQYPDINGNPATGTALYNNYIVFHKCGSTAATDVASAMDQWNNLGTYDPSVAATPIATSVTSYTDSGEASNQQCCYAMRAYYSASGYVLKSATISGGQISGPFLTPPAPQTGIVCATPQLLAPTWSGINSATPAANANGFYSITLGFPALAGTDQANFTKFQADYQLASTCTGQVESCFLWNKAGGVGAYSSNWQSTSLVLTAPNGATAFTPNAEYIFAVRAIHGDTIFNLDESSGTITPNNSLGTDWVYSPRGGNFSYVRTYMHPKVPISSNDPTQPAGFAVSANGPTGYAVTMNMPNGGAGATNGVYNEIVTIVGKTAASVNALRDLLKPASLTGGGGKASQIDLYQTLPANYARFGPLGTNHTFDTSVGGISFQDPGYPYDAIVVYEDVSQQSGSTAVTLFTNLSSGKDVYATQMLAWIDPGQNKLYSLLPDVIPDPKSARLQLTAPSLQGPITISQTNGQLDFTQIKINSPTVLNAVATGGQTTHCEFQIRETLEGANGDYQTAQSLSTGIYDLAGYTTDQTYNFSDCTAANAVGITITGLHPNKKYWLRERAVTVADLQYPNYLTALPSGSLVSTNEATRDVGIVTDVPFWSQPVRPVGDGIVSSPAPTTSGDSEGYLQTTLTYSPPTNAATAGANYVWVFKSVASSPGTAKSTLAAAILNGKSLDSGHPNLRNPNLVAILPYSSTAGAVTYNDHYLVAGLYHAYYMMAVFDTDTTISTNAYGNIISDNPASTYSISMDFDSVTATDFNNSILPPVIVQQPFSRAEFNGLTVGNTPTLVSTDLQSTGSNDGTAFIKLCFQTTGFAPNANNVDAWQVFYSPSSTASTFDYTRPWQTILYGDPARDHTSVDGCILAGGMGNTPGGRGYYVARAYKKAATVPAYDATNFPFSGLDTSTQNDVNVSQAWVVIPNTQANYAYLPNSYTKLGYDMWMATTEMVQNKAGTLPTVNVANDTGTDTTHFSPKLYNCTKSLHESFNTYDSTNCGSGNLGTQTVKSAINVANPVTDVTWNQAWGLCRESSVTVNPPTSGTSITSAPGQMIMRLPTSEEWRRAARMPWDKYSTGVIENNTANCNVGSGTVAKTGSKASCLTGATGNSTTNIYGQLLDMGGNVAEWVDTRMVADDVKGTFRDRFGYPNATSGIVWGRTLHNGIDNVSVNYLMNFAAGTQVFGLALGADYTTAGTYQKQFDNEAEQWPLTTSHSPSIGFRCAAFFPVTSTAPYPTAAQMQMPLEPQYQASEITGLASSWTIPTNRYALQNRPEKIRITAGAGSSFSQLAEGSVSLKWTAYQKYDCTTDTTTCVPAASSGLTYSMFRWEEPNFVDIRGSTPYALTGVGSTYTQVLALDPLAIKDDGTLVSASPPSALLKVISGTCGSTTPWACSLTQNHSNDSTFASSHLYRYMVVVNGSNGQVSFPRRQRFRSPYLAGTPANVLNSIASAQPSFRTEGGFRLAGVFPVDDTYENTFSGQAATGNADPQSMVYVPMDRSGLDRDFFEYKYESSVSANSAGGIAFASAGSGGAAVPGINGGNWDGHAGKCFDENLRLGSSSACSNGNSGTVQSAAHFRAGAYNVANNVAPNSRADYFSACSNSAMLAGDSISGPRYRLRMNTHSEWFAASDWGNLDVTTGNITDPEAPHSGDTVLMVEGDATHAGLCNTPATRILTTPPPHYTGAGTDDPNTVTGGPLNPPNTQVTTQMQCTSRYGGIDMVGNLKEFTDVVYGNGAGAATILDNGVDGVGVNTSMYYPVGSAQNSYSSLDLLRGVQLASGGGAALGTAGFNNNTIRNAGAFSPSGGPLALAYGGDYYVDDTGEEGRYTSHIFAGSYQSGTQNNDFLSMGRCAYGW